MRKPNAPTPAGRSLPAPEGRDHADDLDLVRALPKEVGVLLVILGTGGILLPGPVGSPFLLMGGVVLWPSLFTRFEAAFQRKFPKLHAQSMRQLRRYIDDLEHRYPYQTTSHDGAAHPSA